MEHEHWLNSGFEVGADIPKGVLEPVKPSWQDQFDANNPDGTVTGQTGTGSSTPNGFRAWLDLAFCC